MPADQPVRRAAGPSARRSAERVASEGSSGVAGGPADVVPAGSDPWAQDWFYEPDDDARDRVEADVDVTESDGSEFDGSEFDGSEFDGGAADGAESDGALSDGGAAGPDRGTDPADAVLARARQGRTGLWVETRSSTGRRRRRRSTGPVRYSGPGHDDERDPAVLGDLVAGMVAGRGWERPLAEARVFAEWSELVGPELASRAGPVGLTDGHLRLSAVSTAWATQLRLLAPAILATLATELGAGVVTRLTVTGPAAPSWKHGPRAVPGARGPRDTYG